MFEDGMPIADLRVWQQRRVERIMIKRDNAWHRFLAQGRDNDLAWFQLWHEAYADWRRVTEECALVN